MTEILKNRKFQNTLISFEGVLTASLILLSIHNTVTATGAGYMFFLKTGALTRTAWDIIVDLLVVILTGALIAAPVMIFKAGVKEAVVFMMSGVSLCKLVRPDILITSFTGRESEGIRASLYGMLGYIPTLLIAVFYVWVILSVSSEEDENKKSTVIYACITAALLAASVLISSFHEIFMFVAGYCVLLPTVNRLKNIEEGSILISFVLFAASLWRLYFVLVTY